jgi:hypothetical protein
VHPSGNADGILGAVQQLVEGAQLVQDSEPETDTDLRRRAAWLLAMLAIVAVLFIVVMTQLVGGSDSGGKNDNGPRALDSIAAAHPSTASHSTKPRRPTHAPTTSAGASSGSSTSAVSGTKCPTRQTCILDGDPGNGVAAINDYRVKQGKTPVPGKVSPEAQQCALNNGNGCSGGWAETELADLDGPAAVQKILPFAHLLNSMKSVEVGWAYDPGAKLYYFAIIRQD